MKALKLIEVKMIGWMSAMAIVSKDHVLILVNM